MRIALDTFARSGIEARSGRDLTAGVQVALRHYARRYARRLGSEWDAPAFPRFRRGNPPGEAELELAVDPEVEAVLEQEARESHGVSVEQLAEHAVMVYLADLDRKAAKGACAETVRWAPSRR